MIGKVTLGTFLVAATAGSAHAGGLFLPGTGPVSTARAGAAVASADDAEAIAANPAGIAKVQGTQVNIGASMISYSLSFQRNGSYESPAGIALPWDGQRYPTMHNEAKPAVGIGSYQAIPLIGVVSNCDCRVKGLSLGFAIFAPNAYPTREIGNDYKIDDPSNPPPPTRYDIVMQKATAINPTVAVAYRLTSKLDVGARFTWGISSSESRRFSWGNINYPEWIGDDSEVVVKAKDSFVPGFALGVMFRPTKHLEFGAQYTGQSTINARGTSSVTPSKDLRLRGKEVFFEPTENGDGFDIKCARGGSPTALKACIELALPMYASLGGRYKFLDGNDKFVGDIEVNVQWENWSADRATSPKVLVDGLVNGELELQPTFIRHGFRDTYSIRAAGSFVRPVNGRDLTIRGGAAYDTAAATKGWERLDFDGAARTMLTIGASYKLEKTRIDIGGGAALQGTRDVGGNCNPTTQAPGCVGDGSETPVKDRQGWDPSRSTFPLDSQTENPVNHGRYQSHYILIMLGVSRWF